MGITLTCTVIGAGASPLKPKEGLNGAPAGGGLFGAGQGSQRAEQRRGSRDGNGDVSASGTSPLCFSVGGIVNLRARKISGCNGTWVMGTGGDFWRRCTVAVRGMGRTAVRPVPPSGSFPSVHLCDNAMDRLKAKMPGRRRRGSRRQVHKRHRQIRIKGLSLGQSLLP